MEAWKYVDRWMPWVSEDVNLSEGWSSPLAYQVHVEKVHYVGNNEKDWKMRFCDSCTDNFRSNVRKWPSFSGVEARKFWCFVSLYILQRGFDVSFPALLLSEQDAYYFPLTKRRPMIWIQSKSMREHVVIIINLSVTNIHRGQLSLWDNILKKLIVLL